MRPQILPFKQLMQCNNIDLEQTSMYRFINVCHFQTRYMNAVLTSTLLPYNEIS